MLEDSLLKRPPVFFLIALFALVLQAPTNAQKRSYTTKRVNPHPPVIDGRLNDTAWATVPWGDGFIQREPYEEEEPSQQTAFKILYDDRNVYVGVRCYDTEPDEIVKRLSRRDEHEGDWIGIQFDSFQDHRTAFTFIANAGGVKIDGIFTNDGENEDWSLDPVWIVKTAFDDEGWSAEMEIPLSQLRFGRQELHVWGLQVARYLYRKEELSCWQHIPKDAPGWVHQFGELHGIQGIRPSRRIELLPYTVGQIESSESESGNPFRPGRSAGFDLGLDGKLGITSDITLDFTINPDFGQVEADPSVVNLTAYETFFAEKRPFFIEGKNILDYGIMIGDGDVSNDNLFYSRRIGGPASYSPDLGEGEHVRIPEYTSILGAMKLTGKTSSGLSIGIMDAVTARERAEIDLNGNRRFETVEPMTNYFMVRVQKDFNDGASNIGGIVTNTIRDIDDVRLDFLNQSAITGGLDFTHQWKDRTYFLTLKTVFSHVRGSEEAILREQCSSRRYYQRPDAGHVTLDSSRTHLSGYGGSLFFGRSGNSHLNFIVGATWRSPGLELNDMGYLRYADLILQFSWAGYRIWEPFAIFRSMNFNVNQWSIWDFNWNNTNNGGNFNFNLQFMNYWNIGSGLNYNTASLSNSSLRGGPSMLFPGSWNYWFYLSTDSKKAFQFSVNGSENWRQDGISRSYSVYPGITWRPNNTLSFSINPFYNLNKDNLQYVTTLDYGDQKRYIFGLIEQKTSGLILRLNYAITPTLTIQYYGQPFVSAGLYSDFKRITQPRAGAYEDRFHTFRGEEITYDAESEEYRIDEDLDGDGDYGFDLPDFNFRQFRSNLVIRWEYTPGSTLFLVWSQERTGFEGTGVFSIDNDFRALFDVYPHDVFLLKFNRWFSL